MKKYTPLCCFCSIKEGKYKCSSCKSAFYCSKECQTNDWKKHKNMCKFLIKDIKKVLCEYSPKIENIINTNKHSIFAELRKNKFNPNNSFLFINSIIDITDDLSSYKKVRWHQVNNPKFNDSNPKSGCLNYSIVENSLKGMYKIRKSKDLVDKRTFEIYYLYNQYAQNVYDKVIYTYILKAGEYAHHLQISHIR